MSAGREAAPASVRRAQADRGLRVVVSGYLGFGNLGDEALFAGLARGLRERGHEVVALSADPAATRAAHGVAAAHRTVGLPGALLRADALVSGGGGLLQDATSRRSLSYYLGVIRAARAFRKRVVVFGQSIGPLSDDGRERVARALAGVPILVRDRASGRLLAHLGLSSELVADTALLLAPDADVGVAATATGALAPADGEAARSDAPEAMDDAPLLLIPRAFVPGATEALVAVARDAVGAGRPVAAMALQPGPDEEDVLRIVREVPGVRRWEARDAAAALARCAQAACVVSVRLHGLILALRAGRPHVGIGYDPKVAGFLAESGGACVPVPVDARALVRAVRERPPLDPARRDALLARARAGIDRLHEALIRP